MTRKLFLTLSILALFASCGARRNAPIAGHTTVTEQGVLFNGVRWATHNVDAPGTFAANPEDTGMFFQWNRRQGWAATIEIPQWERSTPTGTEWESENDPCPPGWRVPTIDELQSLFQLRKEWVTLYGVYGTLFGMAPHQVFLPATTRRTRNHLVEPVYHLGGYWSSSQYDDENARFLMFDRHYVQLTAASRESLLPLRCVAKDSALMEGQGVVIDGVRWATHNVDVPGTFTENAQDRGMYFQWNRKTGWGVRGWDNSVPTGTKWEAENDPCPPGWRVPTAEEMYDLFRVGGIPSLRNNVRGYLFGTAPNQIFLPAAGVRLNYCGTPYRASGVGFYWSSTLLNVDNDEQAVRLGFSWEGATLFWSMRNIGGSVRCVAK